MAITGTTQVGAARPNAHMYLHVHSHHPGVVITMLNKLFLCEITMVLGLTNYLSRWNTRGASKKTNFQVIFGLTAFYCKL